MSRDKKNPTDAEMEREILAGRKFSLAEAIGRMAGKNLLKGASPVTRKIQSKLVIEHYIETYLVDSEGSLQIILLLRVAESQILFEMNYEFPLDALAQYVEGLLNSEARLERFVTQVDAEWGRLYLERPHFQKEGSPPDHDDPYTYSSVRKKLAQLGEKLHDES